MEKLEQDYEKFNKVRENSAAERQAINKIVDDYLKKQINGNTSFKDVLARYFEKYKDIFDSPLIEPLNTAKRMELLKRAIYFHEIKQLEKERPEDIRKAA